MRPRIISAAMALTVLLSFVSFSYTQAADRHITIDKARNMAMENSDGYQSASIDLVKKRIELRQAKEAIQDTRKNESAVRFSLLFNIKFPEKHGMPKEIELLTKVPQIENEITILGKKKAYERLSSQTKAEQAFYDVLLAAHKEEYTDSRLGDYKNVLSKVEKQALMGTGKASDKDYIQANIDALKNQKERNATSFDNKKYALGRLIGADIKLGYTFQENISNLSISRRQLQEVIDYAVKNDFELFQAAQNRKLAENETETALGIYKSRYGGYVSDVESYIRSHEGKTINYEDFISKYETTLYNIDSPWYGDYVIRIIFFKIRIPKEWFKGEYSGTRYMEDEKYALFTSLVERDKARKEEQRVKESLIDSIKNSYEMLKSSEASIREAEENIQKQQIYYEKQLNENRMGVLDFIDLESTRESLYSQQESLYELKVDYAKSLSSFNLDTSGYINKILGTGDIPEQEYNAGVSVKGKALWYVKTNITDYNFIFGVNISEDYDVDEYRLYYGDMPVGNRVSIDEETVHSALTYQDTEVLKAVFYKGGAPAYEALFEGDNYEGELYMVELAEGVNTNPQGDGGKRQGVWSIVDLNSLKCEFSVDVNESYDFDRYEVYNDNVLIGSIEKNQKLTLLKIYFNPIDNVHIRLTKKGIETAVLYLEQGADGNILVIKDGG